MKRLVTLLAVLVLCSAAWAVPLASWTPATADLNMVLTAGASGNTWTNVAGAPVQFRYFVPNSSPFGMLPQPGLLNVYLNTIQFATVSSGIITSTGWDGYIEILDSLGTTSLMRAAVTGGTFFSMAGGSAGAFGATFPSAVITSAYLSITGTSQATAFSYTGGSFPATVMTAPQLVVGFSQWSDGTFSGDSAPEPATMILLGSALLVIGVWRRNIQRVDN
jgi:hypothetical protein